MSSQKKFVAKGPYKGETAVIAGKIDKTKVLVELIDFHTGKPTGESAIPMRKRYLQPM